MTLHHKEQINKILQKSEKGRLNPSEIQYDNRNSDAVARRYLQFGCNEAEASL